MNRRHLLQLGLGSAGLVALGGVGLRLGHAGETAPTRPDALTLSDEAWRALLTPQEFHVLREQGTERAFTSDLLEGKTDGVYVCAGCGLPLYDSSTKFDSGTGWPSFWAPIGDDRIVEQSDFTYGMVRTELHCARCGGHQGHVFSDGPPPTGRRHCINGVSLDLADRKTAKLLDRKGLPVLRGGLDGDDFRALTGTAATPPPEAK